MTHRQVQELLGAYALDAVDADEAEAVELHLRECPRCRDEVQGHRETAAMLAHVGAPAPEGVWGRIAQHLEGDQPTEAAPTPPPGSGRSGGLHALPGGAVGRPSTGPTRSVPMRAAAAVLAVAAALIAVLAVQVGRLDSRLDGVSAALSKRSADQAALAALARPDGRRVHLQSADGGQGADAVLLPDGQAYLVADRLPALSADQTYQLWAVVGGEKISVGVLGPQPVVAAFRYSAEPSALAITAERAGGVVSSQKTPVVVGAVGA
jgi:hypothetical protein